MDAERLLSEARRPLCIGIGGGGDVVGALATGEACRLYAGAEPVVGGVTWERRPIDPLPGPRRADEIAAAEVLAPGVLMARPETCVRASGVRFAEARMAEFLGEPTVVVDVNEGPATLAAGLGKAAAELGCDLLVLVDVGGDALAHGDEPGLASPLCDALMLAAGALLAATGPLPVLAGVFGIGCDGELRPAEVLERLAEVGRAGGLAGWRGLTEAVVERLDGAVGAVPTEASAQALRCFRGEHERVAERAREARLVPMRERVAANVHQHQEVAAKLRCGLAEPGRERRGTLVHIHEDRGLAQELGHPRLGEAHPAGAHARLRPRHQHPGREQLRSRDLARPARPRLRVDRPALPGHAAHDRLRARVEPARLAGGERTHHVAAAADADAERAPRLGEEPLGVHQRVTRVIDSG